MLALAAAVLVISACNRPLPEPPQTATFTPASATAPGLPGAQDVEAVLPPPYTVVTTTLLTDPSGFPGGPAFSGEGAIFVAGLAGRLTALTRSGEILWQTDLPANAAGTPLVSGDRLYALDEAGLNGFTIGGEPLWRFEHEAGSAIAGPSAGPDGTLYYTIQAASQGHIQAVSPAGEPLWLARVATLSFYRTPLATPNGQFVLFKSEVFSTIDGSPVDLGLDFEPEAFFVGEDRQVYLLFQDSLVRWSYAGGRAVLEESRVSSPHELGPPVLAGILENGEVWFVYPTAVAWFTPAGRMTHLARVEEGFFTHFIAGSEGRYIVCGRSRADLRENGLPNCAAFSSEYALPLWNRVISPAAAEFTGGAGFPDGAVVALEDGRLVRIEVQEGP